MFKIIPSHRLTLHSPLNVETMTANLAVVVKPRRPWHKQWANGDAHFMGEVRDTSFDILRDINYRNSFLPRIRGTFAENKNGGCTINVEMSVHPAAAWFLRFWLTCVGLFFLIFLLQALYASPAETKTIVGALIPLGMFAFGVALPYFCFWPEARKAETFLRQITTSKDS